VGITWDKTRWDDTYGWRLSGILTREGTATPYEPCTLDASTDTVTKVGHGWQIDDVVFFRNAPPDFEQGDARHTLMNVTIDTFQLRAASGDVIPIHTSGAAEVALSRNGEWMSYSNEMFSRDDRDQQFYLRRDRILAAFPEIQTTDRILVAGCSFLGKLVQAFREGGYTETYGVDGSDYQGRPTGDEPAAGVVVVSENIGAPAIKTRLRQQTGDDLFRVVISEDMLTSAGDPLADTATRLVEAAQWAVIGGEDIHGVTSNNDGTPRNLIIHLVSVNAPPPSISQTLLQWQTLAPAHSWADGNAKTILKG
jgi:hypothetical protein